MRIVGAMTFGPHQDLLLLALLIAIAALLVLAPILRTPYPILLVLGGLALRIVAIVEGESLVNDGTALVLYRVAVVAVVSGSFSIWNAGLRFVWTAAGGIAVGLVIGFLIAAVRRRLDNPPVEVTIAILSGYFAYLPASSLNVSGVLAVVTARAYLGW